MDGLKTASDTCLGAIRRLTHFPQIYSQGSPYGANAIQWQRIANYSKQRYGGSMIIFGVLTQQGACDDKGGEAACPGTYNSPT